MSYSDRYSIFSLASLYKNTSCSQTHIGVFRCSLECASLSIIECWPLLPSLLALFKAGWVVLQTAGSGIHKRAGKP